MSYHNLPLIVQNKFLTMDSVEIEAFWEQYNRRKKSIITAYFLLLFLGWHYAYVNKWGTQFLCWISLWGLLLWWIIDWFRIPTIISTYNNDLAITILRDFSLINQNSYSTHKNQSNLEMIEWQNKNPNATLNDYFKQLQR